MMDEIELSIRNAWFNLADKLARDPDERRRRLDRATKLRTLARPPRAWCLAIRASDTRISPSHRVTDAPGHAAETIQLDRATIVALTRPVELEPPGHLITDVAKKLGTSPHNLLYARVKGVFRTSYLRIGRGKPRPLLYTDQPLDPSSRGFAAPDPVWSWTAQYLPSRLPRDFPPQRLTRVQVYAPRGPNHSIDPDDLHPEHPARDGPAPSRRRSLVLPPAPPDYVAYKWKLGEYVGHDWKKPHIAAAYAKKQRSLELSRPAQRRRRMENPPPSKSKGSLEFRGHRWRCPKCAKLVNVLYLPLPPISLIADKWPVAGGQWSAKEKRGTARRRRDGSSLATDHWPLTTHDFACKSCHGVHYISATKPSVAWNEFVTYLSGGLLFGHEVKRPAWFTPKRKNQYAPKLNRPPSARRIQIQERMLEGQTIDQIAKDLSLSKGTILFYSTQIYQQQGVRCLKELLIKHGKPTRPGMRGPGTAPRGSGSARERKRGARVRAQPREPRMV